MGVRTETRSPGIRRGSEIIDGASAKFARDFQSRDLTFPSADQDARDRTPTPFVINARDAEASSSKEGYCHDPVLTFPVKPGLDFLTWLVSATKGHVDAISKSDVSHDEADPQTFSPHSVPI